MSKEASKHSRTVYEQFISGGRSWGYWRLLFVLMAVGICILAGYFLHGGGGVAAVMRALIFPLAALIGALWVVSRYVQDIYELPDGKLGFQYLRAAAFGILHPRLAVKDGKKSVKPGEVNLLDSIGGPGYMTVAAGSAVLLERLTGPSNICGAGFHYINRLERVKEIISLEDQHGFVEEMRATTKDGFFVRIRDVHYRYRLRTGKRYGDFAQRTPSEPYRFSKQAVLDMTYNRSVRVGGITSLADSVKLAVDSVVTGYVQSSQIDQITAPATSEKDPREEVRRQLFGKGARERLRKMGVELLWADVGHFEIAEKAVGEQRADTWQSSWVGSANMTRASGEARRLAFQELGRAEMQSEMFRSILAALNNANLSGNSSDNLRNIILLRSAQILDALSERPQIEPGKHSE